MSFNENTPLKKVAFRYSGVYIFYEDEIPFAESDIYILKKDLLIMQFIGHLFTVSLNISLRIW